MKTKRTLEMMRSDCYKVAHDLGTAAWKEYMQTGGMGALYLVGRPSLEGIWQEFLIGRDDSELPCVRPERLPRNLTLDGTIAYIHAILKKEPSYIYAD